MAAGAPKPDSRASTSAVGQERGHRRCNGPVRTRLRTLQSQVSAPAQTDTVPQHTLVHPYSRHIPDDEVVMSDSLECGSHVGSPSPSELDMKDRA